jgi:tripartite-type tricarboxylate transporter receptor subunit TctC
VDVVARIIAQKMLEITGQPVVVDNRPGAAGTIGTEIVVRSPADGYTILMPTIPLAVNASLYDKLPFDAEKDLTPISQVASAPFVLAVHPSLPVTSVKELIALAKAKPGKINYASSGNGANLHIAAELFKMQSHTDIVRIPYKGGGPALTALLSNEVQVSFLGVVTVVPLVKSNRIRALGVTSTRRSAVMPDLPTIAEAGVPGYAFTSWYAVFAPAGLPAPIVATLHDQLVKAAQAKESAERFAKEGADVVAGTPVQLRDHLKLELVKWAQMVKESGLKPE